MNRRDGRRSSKVPTPKPTKNTTTAAERIAGAARAYGRWVSRSPDTRGLANGLAVLYPAGEIAHQCATGPDALWLAGLAPPAAVAAWVGTYKAHGSPKYSATIAATAAGVPAWIATAAHTGVLNVPTLVAYTACSVGAWSGYTWSDVLKQRRAWKAEQAKWETLASAAGLEGSRLIGVEDTRLGQRFRVDVRGTGKSGAQHVRTKLNEQIAMVLGIGAEQVRISDDAKNAGVITITLRLLDPWKEAVPHPVLTGQAPAAGRRRSVMDGPFVIGTDPETGRDLEVVIYDEAGGHHLLMVAPTGSGKTVVYCNIIEQATACNDVLVWGIDLGKGHLPGMWGPALDVTAGLDEYDRALMILNWAVTVVKQRSRGHIGNHVPTPAAPIVLVPVDEMNTLVGINSPIAHKAKPLVDEILQRGRSAGVIMATAGQRGVVQHTGTKESHANADIKIVLRVKRAAEMGNVIPEWELDGMPNMASYARGVRGVALVVDGENNWLAGRVRDMSNVPNVQALAEQRVPVAALEPHIAEMLPGYADRHATASITGGQAESRPAGTTLADRPAGPSSGHHGTGGGFGIDPEDHDAVTRLSRDMVAEVEAALADMPTPPAAPTSLADLMNAKKVIDNAEHNTPEVNREVPVPPEVSGPVLDLLAERGSEGARRDELVTTLGKPQSSVKRWLRIMRDHGLIVVQGSTRSARYLLPEHADDTTPDNHGQ
ncbi:MAG: hypothetical protein ACRDS0_03760 [Pseudonocardiaceae bacterium]